MGHSLIQEKKRKRTKRICTQKYCEKRKARKAKIPGNNALFAWKDSQRWFDNKFSTESVVLLSSKTGRPCPRIDRRPGVKCRGNGCLGYRIFTSRIDRVIKYGTLGPIQFRLRANGAGIRGGLANWPFWTYPTRTPRALLLGMWDARNLRAFIKITIFV